MFVKSFSMRDCDGYVNKYSSWVYSVTSHCQNRQRKRAMFFSWWATMQPSATIISCANLADPSHETRESQHSLRVLFRSSLSHWEPWRWLSHLSWNFSSLYIQAFSGTEEWPQNHPCLQGSSRVHDIILIRQLMWQWYVGRLSRFTSRDCFEAFNSELCAASEAIMKSIPDRFSLWISVHRRTESFSIHLVM